MSVSKSSAASGPELDLHGDVYVGLGSNIDPEQNLHLGVRELRKRYGELEIRPSIAASASASKATTF